MHARVMIATTALLLLCRTAGANLLNNPGFEDKLSDWSSTGNAAIRTGDPAPHEGLNYVFGDTTERYTVWQDVRLSDHGYSDDRIDSGNLDAHYGGWQAGWNTQTDEGQISIRFLDEALAEIDRDELPFFHSNHTWVEQSAVAGIPAGTRWIRYHFEGVRHQGSNNDAYLDEAYVVLESALRRGDMNCDGSVDFNDIDPFVTALISRDDYESQYPDCDWLNGDIDESGAVDFNDIDGFVECLINGGCD